METKHVRYRCSPKLMDYNSLCTRVRRLAKTFQAQLLLLFVPAGYNDLIEF